MQLAENSNELSFETIQKELSLSENDVEAFIIEGTKTGHSYITNMHFLFIFFYFSFYSIKD